MYEWPSTPATPAQEQFVNSNSYEATYYSLRMGGKTEAIRMAAVRAINTPGVNALIVSRSSGQSMDMVEPFLEWAKDNPDIEWDRINQRLLFSNGSRITFMSMGQIPAAPSMVLDFLGVDNAEHMDYLDDGKLRMRLRGKALSPPQVRFTENRPDVEEEW